MMQTGLGVVVHSISNTDSGNLVGRTFAFNARSHRFDSHGGLTLLGGLELRALDKELSLLFCIFAMRSINQTKNRLY